VRDYASSCSNRNRRTYLCMGLLGAILISCDSIATQQGLDAANRVLDSVRVSSAFKALAPPGVWGDSNPFPWIAQVYSGPARLIQPNVAVPASDFSPGGGVSPPPGSPFLAQTYRVLSIWHGPNPANASLPCVVMVSSPTRGSLGDTGKFAISVLCPAPGASLPPHAAAGGRAINTLGRSHAA
jgi:hypothetical protein